MGLPSLFERACRIHQLASESNVHEETIREGCNDFLECEDMINKLGLFSANETREDISTTNLKYILVPFYLAQLTEKTEVDDDDGRIRLLHFSAKKLKEFLSFCEAMDLVPEGELLGSSSFPNNPADRRAQKIGRFRRQRAAESKLLEIKEGKERRGRSTKASAPVDDDAGEEEEASNDDGDEERQAWLTTLSLSICKALDLAEMLKREEEMLSTVVKEEHSRPFLEERLRRVERRHEDAAARASSTRPAQRPITCAAFAQDVLEGRASVSDAHDHRGKQPLLFGPSSLISGGGGSAREQVAARVFQPAFRLPTISIEEAGLREMQMMNTWQERNSRLAAEAATSSWHSDGRLAEDDDGDGARAWDDWKDDHPRGFGNKKLTPCG